MKTTPKSLTPNDLSPYRAYLKGRVLVALDIDGDEHYEIAPTPGGERPFVLSTQADCLVNVLSEEAAIALTIGVTQSAKDPVLSKAIIETMVAACLERPPEAPEGSGAPAAPTQAKVAKRGRPRLKQDGVRTGRLSARKSAQGNTPTPPAQS